MLEAPNTIFLSFLNTETEKLIIGKQFSREKLNESNGPGVLFSKAFPDSLLCAHCLH